MKVLRISHTLLTLEQDCIESTQYFVLLDIEQHNSMIDSFTNMVVDASNKEIDYNEINIDFDPSIPKMDINLSDIPCEDTHSVLKLLDEQLPLMRNFSPKIYIPFTESTLDMVVDVVDLTLDEIDVLSRFGHLSKLC